MFEIGNFLIIVAVALALIMVAVQVYTDIVISDNWGLKDAGLPQCRHFMCSSPVVGIKPAAVAAGYFVLSAAMLRAFPVGGYGRLVAAQLLACFQQLGPLGIIRAFRKVVDVVAVQFGMTSDMEVHAVLEVRHVLEVEAAVVAALDEALEPASGLVERFEFVPQPMSQQRIKHSALEGDPEVVRRHHFVPAEDAGERLVAFQAPL
jgi:hypothetical protein